MQMLLNPQKKKAFFSGRARDAEAGSSAVGDPSASLPSKMRKLIFDLNELAKIWDIPIYELREIVIDNNIVIRQKKEATKGEHTSAKLAQALASVDGSVDVQRIIKPRKFISYNIVNKQHMVSDLNDRNDK
ncbi:unnamed protein product [Lactuca saligna]|uniref:Uncharacterized protein n=1 Tax=Lactuca saligna TaxID=75948 RepID=A0AA36A0U0_LACSI|nr:unnamed protein product [Lactuca saligna]